jgi:hypothetical protein
MPLLGTSASQNTRSFLFSATGGSTVTADGYTYHVFQSSGDFTIVGSKTIEVLAIAGGGGAAEGGGGAGGLVYASNISVVTGNYPVVIGAGGRGDTGAITSANGSNTYMTGSGMTVSIGGGAGRSNGIAGNNGGSGGGGSGAFPSGLIGGTGTAGQGFNGGYGASGKGAPRGGGGGGSGQVGSNSSGGYAPGGNGTNAYSVWISAITSTMSNIDGWATATAGGYIAGGGSGGSDPGIAGGLGGGGASRNNYPDVGAENTGSGGGGYGNAYGGAGGSGLLVVRYAA